MSKKRFTIRVYGLFINEYRELLITDEFIDDKYLTKLPGGGLIFGESLLDCLKREWKEELNAEIEVKEHIYTTDFFLTSIFNPNVQVICIYYKVNLISSLEVKIKTIPFDFEKLYNGCQSFRFIKIDEIDENDFILPTDKKVISILKSEYLK